MMQMQRAKAQAIRKANQTEANDDDLQKELEDMQLD